MPEVSGHMKALIVRKPRIWATRMGHACPRCFWAAEPRPLIKTSFVGSERVELLDRVLQDCFLDLVAVRVLNPRLIADSSQVLDKPKCVPRIVGMYFRGSARTLCFHNHTHMSSFAAFVAARGLTPVCFKQKRSSGFASHGISMTGGLAPPNQNDYRWPDSNASNRQPRCIGYLFVAIAQDRTLHWRNQASREAPCVGILWSNRFDPSRPTSR
jgi:hypothetical protein